MFGQGQRQPSAQQAPGRGRAVHAQLRAGPEETRAAKKMRDQNKDPADHVRSRVQCFTARETSGFTAGLDSTLFFVFHFLDIFTLKRLKLFF